MTFTFTMDAFPGYTAFDNTKKVLCCIQVVNDTDTSSEDVESVMGHNASETDTGVKDKTSFEYSVSDSVKNGTMTDAFKIPAAKEE